MTIKKFFLLSLFSFIITSSVFSQILEPAKWEHEVEQISDTEYNLIFTATIEDGWFIYSQKNLGGFAPQTFFEYRNQEANYQLTGITTEPDAKPKYDAIFDEDVIKFGSEVQFTQRILKLNKEFNTIEVFVEYQTCNDEKCIPGDHTFTINLDGSKAKIETVVID